MDRLSVVVYRHSMAVSNPWLDALAEGISKHGADVTRAAYSDDVGTPDVAVLYGVGQKELIASLQARGTRCLIMEMGYVGDRNKYQSLLFDGLNGKGMHPKATDGGARWDRLFGHHMQPWREGGKYVLIAGQWHKDQSVRHLNCAAWYDAAHTAAQVHGLPVRFRRHPAYGRSIAHPRIDIPQLTGTEEAAISNAALVCTINSNFGVISALAGVPVCATDPGSMAWDVATHNVGDAPIRPDRTEWAHNLAFAQWTIEEMASGEAWNHLRSEAKRKPAPVSARTARTAVVVGHGRSPEGQGWGKRIDSADLVLRMWDWHWQSETDYGRKYDIGFYEASKAWMPNFWQHNQHTPEQGWVASFWGNSPKHCKTPDRSTFVCQERWCEQAKAMGGHGLNPELLHFTRGAIATCWLIENSKPGDKIILVGFDNVRARWCLSVEEGYSEIYRAQPSTFTFKHYIPGGPRHSCHDFSIEFPYMQRLAAEHGVEIVFADDVWGNGEPKWRARPKRLSAIVLGDAACVDADVEAAMKLFEPDAIAATNNMIIRWPNRLDYAVTLHPEPVTDWVGIQKAIKKRRLDGKNIPEVWAHKAHPGVDKVTKDWRGSTGLLAVKVLLEEGFERIVLCGVPMSPDGAHFYSSDKPWKSANAYHKGWLDHRRELEPYVRSLSGWTQRILGAPDHRWLSE